MAYFLTHLTEETITLEKLLIPQEFVSQCGRLNLTNPVVLEPPVGDPLEVELYEDARGFWLRNGWQELTDRYSLRHGHYVVFEYKSYSRFKVLMLGENGVGLEFPAPSFVDVGSNGNQEFGEAEEEEKTVTTDSVEFLGSSFVKDMNHNNKSVGSGRQQALPRSGKSRTTDAGGKRKANCEASRRNRGDRSSFERHEVVNAQNPSMADEPVSKRPSRCQSMESNENQGFMEPAREGDCVDSDFAEFLGLSFLKEMNNNSGGSARQPPQPRCAENAKQKEVMSASKKTRVNGGESRKMNHEAPRSYRGDGIPFGRENAETSHIPSMAEQEASKRPSSSRSGRPTTTTVDGLTSEPDFLLRPVTKGSLQRSCLRMWGGFVERHIANWNGKMVELQVEEETWPVRIVLSKGIPVLSKGWWAFARCNSLKEGDTLVFVPTKTEDLLSVHILRCP